MELFQVYAILVFTIPFFPNSCLPDSDGKKKNDFLLIRVENEHLNNVGKYRAFKSVPLPFNYEEEYKDA